ncbi:type II secretion system F family protein [Mesobacillus subterraneus]|uniref:competence type IV pilus assembly protein ComGB n=1 Tax=Mesobacillus subterraneus TaxID=285983 RepID=UPI00203EFEBE|nr:competence type IV pilus assembly protein ComGB [Mesobacillus subterraneus]MCM3665487.1 type II secretion system F family protein [Mesobacillus subterraneus]MCM3684506.1 type II secretion system F family protein [Mesobacillus subterraneus]
MMENKWPVAEQARFLKRTGELLSRGYPLAEAIESMTFYLEKKRKEDIRRSLDQLREGFPLYSILAQLKFKKDLVSYVYFAEQHGGLARAVTEGSEMVLKREGDYQRLRKLASYPFFLMLLTFILFFFVNRILLPKFTSLFADMNLTPHLYMKAIYSAAAFFPFLLYFLLILSVMLLLHYFFIFKKLSPIEQKVRLTKIPLLGKLLKLLYTHFFSIQLSYLFSGGLSVLDALKVFEHNREEPFSSVLGKEIILKLATGQDFDRAVADYSFFEEELPRIIRHGQKNGKLDQELYFYSSHCLKQLEERTDKTMKTIQPVLYSFIGLLVVSLYLAILLPMFQMIQGI